MDYLKELKAANDAYHLAIDKILMSNIIDTNAKARLGSIVFPTFVNMIQTNEYLESIVQTRVAGTSGV